MSKCNGCSGGRGGCARELELSAPEVHMLCKLGQIPFLPVARQADSELPVYLEDADYPMELYAIALLCLEKKALIELDYHRPLANFDYSAYSAWTLHGTMALTARGQSVLELIELRGIREET